MTNRTDIPLSLMRMALALLDRNGERSSLAACHLQAAIDARTGAWNKPAPGNNDLHIGKQKVNRTQARS